MKSKRESVEALRRLTAFFKITNPEHRLELIELALVDAREDQAN